MGRLVPSSTPGRPTGQRYSPGEVKPANKPVEHAAITFDEPCDRCGNSKIDGQPIARARAKITTPDGDLYLCDHHLHHHAALILERGYDLRKLA